MYYVTLFYKKCTKTTWYENVFVSISRLSYPRAASVWSNPCYFENKDGSLHKECINSV